MVDAIQIKKEMTMKKFLKLIAWILIPVPLIYLAIVWPNLPSEVPLHFNLNGTPDRYGSKTELLAAIIGLTVLNIAVYLLVTNIYRIDPKRYAAANRERLNNIAIATTIFMCGIVSLVIYAASSGSFKFHPGIVYTGVGILFAIIGNYMPNLKPNYFAGIRLPWTLEDPENWRKTHALGGKLWFAGGLLLAILCLFLPARASSIVFFSIMAIIVLIPCAYSFILYRKTQARL
jgi:uncharacterized membrane protein